LELGNPPVVEVGIEFQFDPDPEKRPWGLRTAEPFLEQFKNSLPIIECVQAEEITIEKRNPQGLPEKISGKISLDHVRAHDNEEKHWLEVGNDRMAYRLVRGESHYPGFEIVLEKALEMLKSYIEHFRPIAVHRMVLSYLDIINIEVEQGSGLELDDYFLLGVKLPENTYGPLNAFKIQVAFPESRDNDRMQLEYSTEPSDNVKLRFSMYWRIICANVTSLDTEELRHRLAIANNDMKKCFFACFTPKGLELFDPIS
jgi:uncharacterized protein (TIGR04255 family)